MQDAWFESESARPARNFELRIDRQIDRNFRAGRGLRASAIIGTTNAK
jgi:hypothetical protein